MRIMFCLGSLGIGGAERVITNLANTFVKNNEVAIVVSTPKDKIYELDKKIRYEVIDSLTEKNKIKKIYNRVKNTERIIKEFKPNIIIAFLPEPSIRISMLRKKIDIPVIVSVRDDPKIDYKKMRLYIPMKLYFKNADAFVFQTEEQRSYFSKRIQDNSTIIFNPINSNFICKPFLGERKKKIISAGRLMPQKNQKLLIDAFSIVHKKHPDYELHIYGEGDLRNELQEQINELNLEKNVFLDGLTSNMKEKLYDSSMFVLSSRHEGLPNALLEAMALGTPCITTRFSGGGAEAIIKNNVNGLLVENDSNELSKAINYYIENKEIAKEHGINASEEMKQYTQEAITKKWYEYICSVVDKYNSK